MAVEPGGNSPKGKEVLARFLSDAGYRAEVIANLRAGAYGPGFTLDELNPAEQAFLQSGRWRSVDDQQLRAATESTEFAWT